MKHFFDQVPGLGRVAVSRHAQLRAEASGISEHDFELTLREGASTPDGQGVLWRERDGVRLVIMEQPNPYRGARLVITAYRVQPAANWRAM